jgi:hypothetical protein
MNDLGAARCKYLKRGFSLLFFGAYSKVLALLTVAPSSVEASFLKNV